MIVNKYGESLKIDDRVFTIGNRVFANESSEYSGLYGEVIEIRTGDDKDTDNEGIDVYVSFEVPEDEELIAELEDRFSELYGEPKTIDEIALDLVIMSPEMLDIV